MDYHEIERQIRKYPTLKYPSALKFNPQAINGSNLPNDQKLALVSLFLQFNRGAIAEASGNGKINDAERNQALRALDESVADLSGLSRRDFLRKGAMGALGLLLFGKKASAGEISRAALTKPAMAELVEK